MKRHNLKSKITIFTAIFFTVLFFTKICFALPAFPGAEGFGSDTVGGRSGTVYTVSNTNDSGAGSLRECIEANGSRICVFRTGGTITLSSTLSINNPYISSLPAFRAAVITPNIDSLISPLSVSSSMPVLSICISSSYLRGRGVFFTTR